MRTPAAPLALLFIAACSDGDPPTEGTWVRSIIIPKMSTCGDSVPLDLGDSFQVNPTGGGEFAFAEPFFDAEFVCSYHGEEFDCPAIVAATGSGINDPGDTGMLDVKWTHEVRMEGVFDNKAMVATMTADLTCVGSDCQRYQDSFMIPALPCSYAIEFIADPPGE